MTDREREFADAAREIDESMALAIVGSILRRATLLGSRSRPLTATATATLKASLYTVAAIAGCITHALLLQLMPAIMSPVKPMAYGMVVAFAAFVSIAGFITSRSSATATADSNAGTANTRNN